jgi:hypothetical protein
MDDSRGTRRGRILQVLIAARGDWVPLPRITACATQYNARFFELRRMGLKIVNRIRDVDGVRHSWFRLESGCPPEVRLPADSTHPAPQLPTASDSLFGDLAPDRSYAE